MMRSDAPPSTQIHEPTTEAPKGADPAAGQVDATLVDDERLDPIFTQQFAEHVAVRERGGLVIEWEASG